MGKIYVSVEEVDAYEGSRILYVSDNLDETIKYTTTSEDVYHVAFCKIQTWENGKELGRYFWDDEQEKFIYRIRKDYHWIVPTIEGDVI